MVPVPCQSTVAVPPPAYRRAVAKRGPALHIDALALVGRLRLLALCRLAVHQAQRRGVTVDRAAAHALAALAAP